MARMTSIRTCSDNSPASSLSNNHDNIICDYGSVLENAYIPPNFQGSRSMQNSPSKHAQLVKMLNGER